MISFLKKLGQSVLTLWGVSVVVFLLLFVVPRLGKTDPTDAMAQVVAGAHADEENIKSIKRDLGLDKPLLTQYGLFVKSALTNNLKSYRNDDRVFSAILRRFPATLLLAVTALCLYLLIAVPVSLVTSRHAGDWVDKLALFAAILAVSIPTFWLGRLLQHYLGYQLGLFSVGGSANLWNLPLPALTLGVGGAAYYSRLLHANLRGVLKQDYIRAARARGLSEREVVGKHALKNALIPAVAVLGAEFASLLSGLIFTEKIFGWPGIGSLAVDSVTNQDVPMIMGTVLFAALMVVSANLLVDIAYRIIDPRIRAE
ncbi:peptide/nickel transport system permease protein [Abditibacterium utsteinense]|uniref:Peptide/nickel transport system permease protein n=1 Tax=Abditibacterium utsteinense TaxID=1960156 RepID=A0A2S8SV60_9BACT|nr:ABC transporter permease [Abditibacterium utsteinense]PQV64666.1 peptide/nickel transport system permease protein [Abditibacterium utsteinense]